MNDAGYESSPEWSPVEGDEESGMPTQPVDDGGATTASVSTSASSDEGGEPRQLARQLFARARARIERRLQRVGDHRSDYDEIPSDKQIWQEPNDTLLQTVTVYPYGSQETRKRLAVARQEPISMVPPEILCLIFSYMTSKSDLLNIALTCKAWAEMIVELIWFRPGISDKKVYKNLGAVMKLPVGKTYWDYRLYIKRLNLSLVPSLVTDTYLDLFQGCHNLERITLVNCNHISSQAISRLIKGCSRLQSIDLTGVKRIEDCIYNSLAQNCQKLQGLYVPGSYAVTHEAVLSVIHGCPLLKRVKLSDCPGVDAEAIHELVSCCPNLVEVDLHGCTKVTNVALHEMFARLEYLKEFKISKNENVTGACFDDDPTDGSRLCLDRLRIVDFTQCPNITDTAVEKFVSLAPRLRNVVLSKCSAITDRALRAIARLGKNLHYVHLGHCSNITDYGARALIKSCYRLQYIDLACCTQLTNATVVELAQLPKLKRIGLVKCSQITDEGILALAENSRSHEDNLERVHLSYCVNLTIYPIYRLLKAFPRLTHISLTGVAQFLRHDITQFCRDPPEEFNPHQKSIFCVFSGEGVRQLREYLTKLIETPQDPQREINELCEIIDTVTDGASPVDDTAVALDTVQAQRRRIFVDTLDRFINGYHGMDISRQKLDMFGRCVFSQLPPVQVPRIQRFFQILQNHPLQAGERHEREHELQRERQRRQQEQVHELQRRQQQMQQRMQQMHQQREQDSLFLHHAQRTTTTATTSSSNNAVVDEGTDMNSDPTERQQRRNNTDGISRQQQQFQQAFLRRTQQTQPARSARRRHDYTSIRRAPVEADLFQRQQYQQRQFEERQLREQRERRARAQGTHADHDIAMQE